MPSLSIAVGVVALCFILVAEFTLVFWLWGLTISEYLASRDPAAGTVYLIALGLFAHHAAGRVPKMSTVFLMVPSGEPIKIKALKFLKYPVSSFVYTR